MKLDPKSAVDFEKEGPTAVVRGEGATETVGVVVGVRERCLDAIGRTRLELDAKDVDIGGGGAVQPTPLSARASVTARSSKS